MSKKQAKRIIARKTRNVLKGTFDGPMHLGTKRAAHMHWGNGMNSRSFRSRNSNALNLSQLEDREIPQPPS